MNLVVYPPKRSIVERLLSKSKVSALESRLRPLTKGLHINAWIEGGMLRLMPYSVEIK